MKIKWLSREFVVLLVVTSCCQNALMSGAMLALQGAKDVMLE